LRLEKNREKAGIESLKFDAGFENGSAENSAVGPMAKRRFHPQFALCVDHARQVVANELGEDLVVRRHVVPTSRVVREQLTGALC
jgi:hypothetical protein